MIFMDIENWDFTNELNKLREENARLKQLLLLTVFLLMLIPGLT